MDNHNDGDFGSSIYRKQLLFDILGVDEGDSLNNDGEEDDESHRSYFELEDVNGNGMEVEDQNESDASCSDVIIFEGINDEHSTPNNYSVEEGPQTGMVFHNLESLMRSYQEHAKLKGFCIAKRTGKRDSNGKEKYVQLVCDKGRKTTATQIKSKRTECPAKINCILKEEGWWQVSKITKVQNHELLPEMSVLMVGHKTMSQNMKRLMEAHDIAGVKISKNIIILQAQAGGPSLLGCGTKDCRNFIYKRRRYRLGEGDAQAIRNMFAIMKKKDRNFTSFMHVDEDGRLVNVLWIHPRYIAAYEEFHNVISFDTTYLVNRYQMPFATIVGVNHHGQSILLGCALISHEDVESFKWLFSNWLKAMGNIHPNAILTDQCESIKLAIREVMPDTIHRFCLWHILCKVPKKFRGVKDLKECIRDFKGLVYDSLTINMFERNWEDFIMKHKLEENQWLKDLYSIRQDWAPVYLQYYFWAGMVSTHRSEGMHALFDSYITPLSTLKQFVEQYEVAICDKIDKEFIADYDSKQKVVMCISAFEFEKQFQQAYIHSMFKLVQQEIKRLWYCHIEPPTDAERLRVQYLNIKGIQMLKVREMQILNDWYVNEFVYTVEYREAGEYLECNCKKMQSKGIPCRHMFKFMSYMNIKHIHSRYLFSRWRKDINRRYSKIFFPGGYPHMTDEYKKYQEVERMFQECTDLAIDSREKLEFVKRRLIVLKGDIENWDITVANERVSESNGHNKINDDNGNNHVLDPLVKRRRGKPKAIRLKPAAEGKRKNSAKKKVNGSNLYHVNKSRGGNCQPINNNTISNQVQATQLHGYNSVEDGLIVTQASRVN